MHRKLAQERRLVSLWRPQADAGAGQHALPELPQRFTFQRGATLGCSSALPGKREQCAASLGVV
jgi:hypothetical protein